MGKIACAAQALVNFAEIHGTLMKSTTGGDCVLGASGVSSDTNMCATLRANNSGALHTVANCKKAADVRGALDTIHLNIVNDEILLLENEYKLCIVNILSSYCDNISNRDTILQYHRVLAQENFAARISDLVSKVKSLGYGFYKVLSMGVLTKVETKKLEYRLNSIMKQLDAAHNNNIELYIEKHNYEVCCCGARMVVHPEVSELHCPNAMCGKIRMIIGAVFRDDQYYPQDGQKSKHGGYDTSRHYRFWIERIQGTENKTFDPEHLDRIEYVLNRDCYDRRTLNCEHIRVVLKDSKVGLTSLNDHATLLVITFGGPPPPKLNFQENRLIAIRFNKTMRLYDIVVPGGGNKPYYPYFIYKIIEYEFRNNPEKLRLLDYIHLQSSETVIKNDKIFEQICELADESDGLVYRPTVPGER